MYVMKLGLKDGEVYTTTVGSWRDYAVERFKAVCEASEHNRLFEGDKLSLVNEYDGSILMEVTL